MAYEMKLRGTEHEVKVRNPWAVALLPFITLGIYHLVWWYRINKEMKAYGEAKGYDLGQNPTNSVLALFPGGIIIVPMLVTYWRGTKRVQGTSKIAGREPVSGWLSIILYLLLYPAFWAYLQVSLNHVWEQEAEALPGGAIPPAQDEMPPRLEGTDSEATR
jgi:prepilin signal peptidase PulO-like enzyme (type II secretory pathway)